MIMMMVYMSRVRRRNGAGGVGIRLGRDRRRCFGWPACLERRRGAFAGRAQQIGRRRFRAGWSFSKRAGFAELDFQGAGRRGIGSRRWFNGAVVQPPIDAKPHTQQDNQYDERLERIHVRSSLTVRNGDIRVATMYDGASKAVAFTVGLGRPFYSPLYGVL
jgi:hypothetical protein